MLSIINLNLNGPHLSPEERLRALVADGCTLELFALQGQTHVILVPAFGDELWAVGDRFEIDLESQRVVPGQLILDRGRPLSDVSVLRARNIAVETVHIST